MNGEWNEKEEKPETKKMQHGSFYSETFKKSIFCGFSLLAHVEGAKQQRWSGEHGHLYMCTLGGSSVLSSYLFSYR
jgi:hypothetical protein